MRILALPDVRQKFETLGMAMIGNSPAEFAAVIRSETEVWAKLIRAVGIKASE